VETLYATKNRTAGRTSRNWTIRTGVELMGYPRSSDMRRLAPGTFVNVSARALVIGRRPTR